MLRRIELLEERVAGLAAIVSNLGRMPMVREVTLCKACGQIGVSSSGSNYCSGSGTGQHVLSFNHPVIIP